MPTGYNIPDSILNPPFIHGYLWLQFFTSKCEDNIIQTCIGLYGLNLFEFTLGRILKELGSLAQLENFSSSHFSTKTLLTVVMHVLTA